MFGKLIIFRELSVSSWDKQNHFIFGVTIEGDEGTLIEIPESFKFVE